MTPARRLHAGLWASRGQRRPPSHRIYAGHHNTRALPPRRARGFAGPEREEEEGRGGATRDGAGEEAFGEGAGEARTGAAGGGDGGQVPDLGEEEKS